MAGILYRIENWEQVAHDADYKAANLAALCHVSDRHLERFFREKFKTTPQKWLSALQCRIAVKRLGEGYSNDAVVEELKFADKFELCHKFRRIFGRTPRSFAPLPGSNRKNVGISQQCRYLTTQLNCNS
jgi:AraC-like DNA-binding protein